MIGLRIKILLIIIFLSVMSISTIQSAEISQKVHTAFEGMIIDSIIIENRNIYDTDQKKFNKFIFKMANKIHLKTQKQVIERIILLKEGSPYTELLAEETARILRKRLVLYDAWLEKEVYDENKLLVRVITIDRWSLAIGADFKREGNEHTIKMGVSEKNLFGQNRQISFHYIDQSADESYTEASFTESRMFGEKLDGRFRYSTNPVASFSLFSLSKPLYELNQDIGFKVTVKFTDERTDYYTNDSITDQTFYTGDNFKSELFYRFGSYDIKYNLQLKYIYSFEKIITTNTESQATSDSLFHIIETGFGYSQYSFKKKFNIDGFNYTEDFNTGKQFRLSFQNAYAPHKSKILYDVIDLNMSKNYITSKSLITCQSFYTYWFDSSEKLRERIGLNLKYYNQSIDNITIACNADIRSDKSKQSVELLTLGGLTGIRGADKYFLTGDRRLVLNTEIRFAPRFSIFSLNIGGLIFSDIGNISHSGDDLMLSETYSSFGIGLRLGFDKSSKNIARFDFAYSSSYGWQLSFGGGQYFRAKEKI